VKNRQRFNFGVLYPSACCQSGDRWRLQMECPIQAAADTTVSVSVRFLQLVDQPAGDTASTTRQEGVERQVTIPPSTIGDLRAATGRRGFECADDACIDVPVGSPPAVAAVLIGMAEVEAAMVADGVDVLTVRVSNLGDSGHGDIDRDEALRRSLVSAHVVVEVRNGALVSLLDPPDSLREVAARCTNLGVWPVLVGEAGSHDRMLASPIILYDYPQIAPESAGDLFDGTEIDEILALRILTLTDEEKGELREGDARARLILDRTEALPPEQWAKLHGAVRGLRRVSGEVS
jgi:hypothetical protein